VPSQQVEAQPYSPLLTYQFRIELLQPPGNPATGDPGGGTPAEAVVAPSVGYVAGVRRVSGLTMNVVATETWEGGNSLHRHANPHRAVWEPIVLEQGLGLDSRLQNWAQAGITFLRTGNIVLGQPVKRNVLIDVFDPGYTATGPARPCFRYLIFNAWVSKYQAIPRLDAMADEVALITVELTHHGWKPEKIS
jgi:phage tail-like protein